MRHGLGCKRPLRWQIARREGDTVARGFASHCHADSDPLRLTGIQLKPGRRDGSAPWNGQASKTETRVAGGGRGAGAQPDRGQIRRQGAGILIDVIGRSNHLGGQSRPVGGGSWTRCQRKRRSRAGRASCGGGPNRCAGSSRRRCKRTCGSRRTGASGRSAQGGSRRRRPSCCGIRGRCSRQGGRCSRCGGRGLTRRRGR